MSTRKLFGHRLFTLWFGWGLPPLLAGALVIAFAESWLLGVAASAVSLAWFYETGRTTCSRCAYHGTAKCGLPGLIAPLLTQKKPAESLSPERIRGHLYLDLWILLFLNSLYALQLCALPIALIWSIGVWRISLGPKRHHGLLYRLRERSPVGDGALQGILIVPIERAQGGWTRLMIALGGSASAAAGSLGRPSTRSFGMPDSRCVGGDR